MRIYLQLIKKTQQFLLTTSIFVLAFLPGAVVFYPELLNYSFLFAAAHLSLFLVMAIRPLADLLPKIRFVRPLVILRKGMGVFSASIIVSFIIAKLIIDPGGYLASYLTAEYWSVGDFSLFVHLADISAVLLLITSNNLSKRLLGPNWKRVQRLSYVYFYGSGLYVFFVLGEHLIMWYMIIVTVLTTLAYFTNLVIRLVAANQANNQTTP